jgi:signal peptidase I
MKYLYHLSSPRPWDVVVFKNPQNNRENYIKRLIGLPGEEIEIVHGNIFVRNWLQEEETFRIRRKPLRTQEAMWQVVYNNDYQPDRSKHFESAGSPEGRRVPIPRWVSPNGSDNWDLTAHGGRMFLFRGSETPDVLELDVQLWPEARHDDQLKERYRRDLYQPHYGYNVTGGATGQGFDPSEAALGTVSDLQLSTVFWPGEKESTLRLGLTSFDHEFRAEVSSAGSVEVLYRHRVKTEGQWVRWGEPETVPDMRQGTGYRVSLAYVDQQLILQVDGRPIIQRTAADRLADGRDVPLMEYETLKSFMREVRNGTAEVRIPQPTIALRGGACRLSHVRLMRDVHYTNTELQGLSGDSSGVAPESRYADTLGVEGDEPGWATFDKPIRLAHHAKGDRPRSMDEFFVLGDNSPQSLDGRGWTSAAPTLRLYSDEGRPVYTLGTVPRYNLLGKAFFVYWPAGFRVPGLENLQIIPNVGKVRLIR